MSQYLEEFLSDARDRIDSISNAVLRLEEAVKTETRRQNELA